MHRFGALVFSRTAGVLAGVLLIVIILGCMSIQIGGKSFHNGLTQDGLFLQEGETTVAAGAEQDVYYSVPFASPPNLELCGLLNDCVLVEQHADHFRVRNPGHFSRDVDWKAKGVKAAPPSCMAPPLAPVPAKETLPPPTPATPNF